MKNIVTKEEPLGAKIVKGVEESRGEVVSFLKDDDLWLPQKLEIVKQVFKDKDVIYYHNKYRLFISTQNSYNLQDLIIYLQENNVKNSPLTLLKNFKCKVANTSVSRGVFLCSHLIRELIVKLYQSFSNILYSPQVSLVQGSLLP